MNDDLGANAPSTPTMPFEALLEPTGLLWLINATVFHPRGYALSIDIDEAGKAVGWQLLGNGKQRWAYDEDTTSEMIDARFTATRRILK